MAGVVRTEYDHKNVNDIMQRTAILFKIASQLKWLSDTFKIAIIVVNQVIFLDSLVCNDVVQVTSAGSSRLPSSSNSYSSETIPALGLAWSHCINTRICLYRDTTAMRSLHFASKEEDSETLSAKSQRQLVLELSSSRASKACMFIIADDGVTGIAGSLLTIGS